MKTRNLKYISDKLITLYAVNIFQPVDKDSLSKQLSNIRSKRLDRILDELINEKRIALEKNHFRLTLKGMYSMIPGDARILRDLQRMEYLSQLNKKGGGVLLG